MQEIIAQIIGVLVLINVIVIGQIKQMKWVLIIELANNVLVLLNFALLGGMNGSLVCFLALFQTVLIFVYNRRNKDLPFALNLLFIAGYIGISLYSFFSAKDYPSSTVINWLIGLIDPNGEKAWLPRLFYGISVALSGAAGVFYSLSVARTDSKNFRKYTMGNAAVWLLYDVYTGAYTTILTHGFLLASCIIGAIRLDRRKEETNDVQGEQP